MGTFPGRTKAVVTGRLRIPRKQEVGSLPGHFHMACSLTFQIILQMSLLH